MALRKRVPRGTLVVEDAAYRDVRGAYELALVKSPPSFFSPKKRGSCRTPGRTLGMPEDPQLALATSAAMIDPRGRWVSRSGTSCALGRASLRPVARANLDRFVRREATLPSHQGIARYVEVIVEMEDCKAAEVVRFGGFQYRVDADAKLDPQHLGEVMALAGQVVLGGALTTELRPGVVAAEHRFAKRRLEHVSRWRLADAQLALLRALVNRKAGAKSCDPGLRGVGRASPVSAAREGVRRLPIAQAWAKMPFVYRHWTGGPR